MELMPVNAFMAERNAGLKDNFWGYETLNFFALEPSYMVSADINNFKKMVKRFHESGLEVILDMVYNIRWKAIIWGRRFVTAE